MRKQRKKRSKLKLSNPGHRSQAPRQIDHSHESSTLTLEALHAGRMPPIEQMAPTVMQLQRTIGNQAVRNLLESSPPTIQKSHVIQRVETGLRSNAPMTQFAGAVHQYATTNKDKSVESLLNFINAQINAALRQLGVTPIVIEDGADASLEGSFSPTTWTIKINADGVFGGKSKISELTKSELTNIVDTLYHEARHAEQHFRMTRFRIGELLLPNAKQEEKDRVLAQLDSELAVSSDIIQDAMKAPIYENPLAAPDSAEAKAYEEARAWYVSRYGMDKDFRKIVMGDFDTAIDGLHDDFKDLQLARRNKNAADIGTSRTAITSKLQECYDIRDGKMKDEILRLAALRQSSPESEMMLDQLRMMTAQLNFIQAMGLTAKTERKIYRIVDAISDILYAAYRTLPMEADAFATGEAITKAYKNAH